MEAPFEYAGSGDICIGCVDIIRTGDTVASMSDDRADRLLCVACWWLQACDLQLPGWTQRGRVGRINLAGVFHASTAEGHRHRRDH
ncbi:MAG: hypothetical protein ACR2KK_00130 [Acidimicrobiales bacterium]